MTPPSLGKSLIDDHAFCFQMAMNVRQFSGKDENFSPQQNFVGLILNMSNYDSTPRFVYKQCAASWTPFYLQSICFPSFPHTHKILYETPHVHVLIKIIVIVYVTV